MNHPNRRNKASLYLNDHLLTDSDSHSIYEEMLPSEQYALMSNYQNEMRGGDIDSGDIEDILDTIGLMCLDLTQTFIKI